MNVKLTRCGSTKAKETLQPIKATGQCPICNTPLEVRKFIDSWDSEDKPCDINEDFYCPKCEIRWLQEPAPHEFYENP